MGFNSYTQTMCIDHAVQIKEGESKTVDSPSQVVTSPSKFVERLSDVVSTMNISYRSAIKKGTIEVSGNGNSIDEDKIKAADINLVVSVQVINQITTVDDTATFKIMDKLEPWSEKFNEVFGDCYISGFIEGGDFNSIVSIRCLDRSKTNSTIRSIKKIAKGNAESQGFTMDSYNMTDSLSTLSALKESETTISVNWMGGGQIKEPQTSWDIDAVYGAAAAFPAAVARSPKRTWAILTKYKANRAFQEWTLDRSLKPLEYDAVISYTAELFNNFMEYKQLVKRVQDIIGNPNDYVDVGMTDSLFVHIKTLVAVRTALRNEMSKIVVVVDMLAKTPHLLAQASSFEFESKNEAVKAIMRDAMRGGSKSIVIKEATTPAGGPATRTSPPSSSSSTGGEAEMVEHPDATKTSPNVSLQKQSETHQATNIDLGALIAPEVWAELLPKKKNPSFERADAADSGAQAAAASMIPRPPLNDATAQFLSGNELNELKVLAAVCGLQDVTQTLQDKVQNRDTLSVRVDEIDKLVQSSVYAKLPANYTKSLAFAYQYGDGEIRICARNYVVGPTETILISRDKTTSNPAALPRPWTTETLSLVSVVYGGRIFTSEDQMKKIEDAVRGNFNKDKTKTRRVTLDNSFLGEDPWQGKLKTAVVFFKSTEVGPVRAAVSLEGKECLLTDQPQFAELVTNQGNIHTNQIIFPPITANGVMSCAFRRADFTIFPSETSFLTFPNGVNFSLESNGNFIVRDSTTVTKWQSDRKRNDTISKRLVFTDDGNLRVYSGEESIWDLDRSGFDQLILSNTAPYIMLTSKSSEPWKSLW